jgi:ribosomal protein L21E
MFKIGDKVRIVSDDCSFEGRSKLIGKIGTVTQSNGLTFIVEVEGGRYIHCYDFNELERVMEAK